MRIPRLIHQIHLGDPMTERVAAWVHSIGRHHPHWSRIIWDVPSLAAIGINPLSADYPQASWAAVSNKLRLELLYRFGGYYLDTDFEAVGELDPLLLLPAQAIAAPQDGGRICNAFMAAEAGSPWIKWQLDHFNDFQTGDAAAGVYLATAAPHEHVHLINQHVVYPWLYDSKPEDRMGHPETILIHHWLGSWVKRTP